MDEDTFMIRTIELNKEIEELNEQLNSLLLDDPEKISNPHITEAFVVLTTLMHKYGIQRSIENQVIFSKLNSLERRYLDFPKN